ncbi:YhcN/YlaJ family sporulation lipoprotein [Bacillus sp. PS06]|nr:YhcN/YlaJ family sporulation lipoprotein [Bacillus sp. PS06]MBD8068438.1 YhcN/YlaJ family sporulation lipoprotein [Bacillus sp. PS06]
MKKLPILFIMSMMLLAGCGNNQNEANEDQDDRIQVQNTTNQNVDRKTGQEIAAHLVELASSIPEVNDATAVVLGKFAVVGIDVNAKLDRSRVESIKYSVAESLKHDPYGANAVVIADADTVERLRQMGKEIQDGRPVVGILDELAQIIGRIMPDIPSDIINNENVDSTETNNNQLDKKSEKELEKEQQDQSNHHKNDQ